MRFDLVVLGDTPDALAAAEEAALLGRRVGVVRLVTDDEAAFSVAAVLAAFDDEASEFPVDSDVPSELWARALRHYEQRLTYLEHELGVRIWNGLARLTGPNSLDLVVDGLTLTAEAELLLIASGTTARRPGALSFDRRMILVPEDVATLNAAPQRLLVLGGNRTARAFARFFEAAGTAVALVDAPTENHFGASTHVITGDVLEVRRESVGVALRLSDGREVRADQLLFATGRAGATASLGLSAAGIKTDEDGRLWCDEDGHTWVSSVSAVGEVVGFPKSLRDDPLAARRIISMEFDGLPTRRFRIEPASSQRGLRRRQQMSPDAASPRFRVVGDWDDAAEESSLR